MPRVRCFIVALTLPAAGGLFGAESTDSPILPLRRLRYPVTITRRDGTSFDGDLTGISDGQIMVKTPKGVRALGGDEIRSITPIDPFVPRRGVWRRHPPTEQEKREMRNRLQHKQMAFIGMFSSPKIPPPEKAFEAISTISLLAVGLQARELPLRAIEQARDSNQLNRDGSRKDLLLACEVIAYRALGDMERHQRVQGKLDHYWKNRLREFGVKWFQKRRRGGRRARDAAKGP